MTRFCIPALAEATGVEPIVSWFLCGGLGVFAPLVIAGVVMLRKEGLTLSKQTFVERLRFRRMTGCDWKYSLLALGIIGVLTFGIMTLMQAYVPGFDHTPSFMVLEPLSAGRYWILLAWFPFWILNIYIESYVVAKTQNSWCGVFLHATINGPSFIAISLGLI